MSSIQKYAVRIPSLYQFPGCRFAPDDAGNVQQTVSNPPQNANGGGNAGTSQEELNRQFAERAKRAEEAERKRMLDALGVQSEDDLKAIIEAKKQADDAAKTELQKMADKAVAAESAAAKLKAENEAKEALYQRRLQDAEIKLLALRAIADKDGKVVRGAFRPEAMDAALLLIDRTGIVEKDGKYEGIDKALDALAKAHGYMLLTAGTQPAAKGTPSPGATQRFKTAGSSDVHDDDALGFLSL